MSNECRRVITLHTLTEISRILQIKENISISRQTLKYEGRDVVAVISFQNYDTQEGTGKVVYKPSVLDERQLHVKQDRLGSHKSAD